MKNKKGGLWFLLWSCAGEKRGGEEDKEKEGGIHEGTRKRDEDGGKEILSIK